MPTGALTSAEDLEDFIRGLTVLGTGGGGRPDAGRAALLPLIEQGGQPCWRPLEGIGDDDLFCSLSGLGSIAPVPPMSEEERVAAGYPRQMQAEPPMLRALKALEAHLGRKIAGIYPIELGAGNSPMPLAAAMAAGIDMVDCDCAGRAIPEMSQSTIARSGIPFAPAVYADHWGMLMTVSDCNSMLLGERLGKAISTVTKAADMKAQLARAAFVVDGRTLKRHALSGGLSQALQLGRAISAARRAGTDATDAAAAAMGGRVVHRGRLVRKSWESREGYMFGDLYIDAADGSKARIWLKNENHIVWIDDVPRYTSPDLICVVQAHTAEPYTNTTLPEGIDVAVIVAPAPPQLRTPEAIAALGPRHYGFDLDYLPLEIAQ
ncbi:DUF917 domain-containing protein [Ferrovibrio sp.]|uniref:DUF917 domain-containing protein n=1 Tax=Ferrovibrio sp. TaxID=1917215 RepID=UPI0035B44C0D